MMALSLQSSRIDKVVDGPRIDDGSVRETNGDFGGVGSDRIGVGSVSEGE
jgi:hypothetical protein